MSTEIICALISLGGVVASGLLAWLVSNSTAKQQVDQMKLTWAHDDVVSSDDEFADMASEVAMYVTLLHDGNWVIADSARAKVAALRSKESGPLACALDALYATLLRDGAEDIDTALTEVIKQKRKAKGQDD